MYVNLHNHTENSNYRMLDSTNKIDALYEYSRSLGHSGIAITDHETVGSHVSAIHILKELREKDPDKWKDYKLILGNEIYLCSRKKIQEEKDYTFPHFILLAKNARGHKALRELSTRAWCENGFVWVNMRVPTFYDDLMDVMKDYKGDVIAGTACAGGALPRAILAAYNANPLNPNFDSCRAWIDKMVGIFGKENFYLELQPSIQPEQTIINKYLVQLAEEKDLLYVITTDAHYLKKEDRKVHEAFLNSQEADREVGDFYATTYVMSEEEIHEYLDKDLGYDKVEKALSNSIQIASNIEEYTLDKPLNIPYVPDDLTEPSPLLLSKFGNKITLLNEFSQSVYPSDRHLVREILKCLEERPEEFCNEETYEAIQTNLMSIKLASDKQGTPWSAYLLQTKELVNVCWEAGSLVGAGRGSGVGFILLYMLGITQVNPLRENVKTFHWRFLNPERVSPLDIDIDTMGSKKADIIAKMQEKYGGYRHVMKVQTILKAKSKNSIQIACRGLGYTSEEGVYLGSFIQSERGLQYSLHQTFYGDEENGLAPNTEFVNLMTNTYPDVWEVAQQIEGLCVGCGQHAGGVILTKEDAVEDIALMKTKTGEITTQFDLHESEACSLIKWDLLNVDCLEKIKIELDLLLEDGLIEWQGSLKKTYEKYLGVYSLDRDNPEIWDLIDKHKILSLFQFEKSSGWQAIELGQPRSLEAMSALNSVMRLMAQEPGGETPLERYARMRKDISEWYKEMDECGLTKEEQKWLEKYALKNYGLLPNQENFMEIVQDPMVGGYSLLWADTLRKAIAKKNPKAFLELQDEFYKNIEAKKLSYKLCDYVWSVLICMSKGYGFNTSHTLAYSIIALQEANLAYKYPMIYWNCANLISDSGGEEGIVNYGKNASAISRMGSEGIDIVPPYINEAKFDFRPDVKNNRIIFGLKAMAGVGSAQAQTIMEHQPYTSMMDMYHKMQEIKDVNEEAKFGDKTMIQLIKAGAFDDLESFKSREELMEELIREISGPLKKLTMSNLEEMNNLGLLTPLQQQVELEHQRFKKRAFVNEKIAKQSGKSPSTNYYYLSPDDYKYLTEKIDVDKKFVQGKDFDYIDTNYIVKRGSVERLIDRLVEDFQAEVLCNPEMLKKVNDNRFKVTYEEQAQGSLSKWEMDSMVYYYHGHELQNINRDKYGVASFFEAPPEPVIMSNYFMKGQLKPRYQLFTICGTVIDKDNNKDTVTLLTPEGVVVCKFYKGNFGFYARDISKVNPDGTKERVEASWFKRGTKLLVTGFRNGENFVPRVYKDSAFTKTVQKIEAIHEDGSLELKVDRPRIDDNEENI